MVGFLRHCSLSDSSSCNNTNNNINQHPKSNLNFNFTRTRARTTRSFICRSKNSDGCVERLLPVAAWVVLALMPLHQSLAFSTRTSTTRPVHIGYNHNNYGVKTLASSSCLTLSSSLFSSQTGAQEEGTTIIPSNTTAATTTTSTTVDFLHQVEVTVERVLNKYQRQRKSSSSASSSSAIDIFQVPLAERETVGVALHLQQRLQAFRRNNDCPRCWMQRAHCICSMCPPVNITNHNIDNIDNANQQSQNPNHHHCHHDKNLHRIFLLMHHKEICLKVDTAKLILACFPHHCRLVVAGISSDYQESMKELQIAIQTRPQRCLVLFPDDTAQTFSELLGDASDEEKQEQDRENNDENSHNNNGWDVIVIDGTWTQARRMHSRYLPPEKDGGPRRVQLSETAVATLEESSSLSTCIDATTTSTVSSGAVTINTGHQLRRHAVTWRQVGTFEATRLFLKDLLEKEKGSNPEASTMTPPPWEVMKEYQEIANEAARKELGPPRRKPTGTLDC